MSSAEELTRPPPLRQGGEHSALPAAGARLGRLRARLPAVRVGPRHLALAGVLALSAVLNTNRLSQNGYANIFYSAGVKSMLRSLHNFFFVSFDPGGLITRRQAAARPVAAGRERQAVRLLAAQPAAARGDHGRARGRAALLHRRPSLRLARRRSASALALAVFPSFVAVSRDNGVDPLLILLMLLACGAALRAAETGRWRTLLWCARARRPGVQHQDARRLPRRPGHRRRLPRSARRDRCSPPRRAARRRRRRDARRLVLVDRRRRTDARLAAPVRRQLDEQHRARA